MLWSLQSNWVRDGLELLSTAAYGIPTKMKSTWPTKAQSWKAHPSFAKLRFLTAPPPTDFHLRKVTLLSALPCQILRTFTTTFSARYAPDNGRSEMQNIIRVRRAPYQWKCLPKGAGDEPTIYVCLCFRTNYWWQPFHLPACQPSTLQMMGNPGKRGNIVALLFKSVSALVVRYSNPTCNMHSCRIISTFNIRYSRLQKDFPFNGGLLSKTSLENVSSPRIHITEHWRRRPCSILDTVVNNVTAKHLLLSLHFIDLLKLEKIVDSSVSTSYQVPSIPIRCDQISTIRWQSMPAHATWKFRFLIVGGTWSAAWRVCAYGRNHIKWEVMSKMLNQTPLLFLFRWSLAYPNYAFRTSSGSLCCNLCSWSV